MDLREYLEDEGTEHTQTSLAAALGVTQGAVWQWLRDGVPAKRVLQIEQVTNKRVSRHELRPDLYPVEAA